MYEGMVNFISLFIFTSWDSAVEGICRNECNMGSKYGIRDGNMGQDRGCKVCGEEEENWTGSRHMVSLTLGFMLAILCQLHFSCCN